MKSAAIAESVTLHPRPREARVYAISVFGIRALSLDRYACHNRKTWQGALILPVFPRCQTLYFFFPRSPDFLSFFIPPPRRSREKWCSQKTYPPLHSTLSLTRIIRPRFFLEEIPYTITVDSKQRVSSLNDVDSLSPFRVPVPCLGIRA